MIPPLKSDWGGKAKEQKFRSRIEESIKEHWRRWKKYEGNDEKRKRKRWTEFKD